MTHTMYNRRINLSTRYAIYSWEQINQSTSTLQYQTYISFGLLEEYHSIRCNSLYLSIRLKSDLTEKSSELKLCVNWKERS